MKTDNYTKTILTIIAICLTINVVKDFDVFPSAYASEKVETKPINEVMDVRLVDINTSDELNVNLKSVDTYDEVKVNLKKIETSDKLDVNLEEIGGGWVSNGGPIPVKVQ
ncbi:hypothetical protein Aeqsu_2179 [Aequorivita sublithincola DSM 14238]|uniref:Uncharacterized protein n=1 Tax=Aequorivita sublithincola (strain DSM 14238 / LMG 21431 / ACAM 643 / 9-3) TaxID=746697 RepID=I3YXC1_AEQSU|nr:hypothetical protein [Aequorivita sublithincola]AFL81639.1 hypothetical protein Aeqsu_2179 [Aequorivita sublithincola DSM 14238]